MRKNVRPPMPQPGKAKHYAATPPDRPKEPETLQWKNLFTLADEMRRTEPWKWMGSTMLFAVRIPETERIYYGRFTGNSGELPGFLALRGLRGLCHHLLTLRGFTPRSLERSLTRDALGLSFGTKKTMDKDDRTLLTSLKRFYRGGDVWPRFRAQTPWAPESLLNAFEAEDLAPLLSQAMVVAAACRADPHFLAGPEPAPGRVLLREGTWDEDGGVSWESHWIATAVEEIRQQMVPGEPLLQELADGLKHLPRNEDVLRLALRDVAPPHQEEHEESLFSLQGSWERGEDGTFTEPWGGKSFGDHPLELPLRQLSSRILSRSALPGTVVVHTPYLAEALAPLFRSLEVTLRSEPDALPTA